MAREIPSVDRIVARSVRYFFAVRECVDIRRIGAYGDNGLGGHNVVDIARAGAGSVAAVVIADD